MARRPTPGDDPGDDPAAAAAADELYATEPDDFVAVRDRLARQLREAGDADTATRVARLRKPTVAAFVVNRYVLATPEAIDRLVGLNRELREAQTSLEADRLRELTERRRAVVGELARAALADAGRADTSTGLRDEVVATLDAAVADPEVAGRLGRLLRAEHWSGFGVAAGDLPADAPALRLVRGDRDAPKTTPRAAAAQGRTATARKPAAGSGAATTSTALREAELAAASADTGLNDAEQAERTARDRVRELTDELGRVQASLAAACSDHDRARRQVTAAQSRRRRAQAALQRARRNA
jgi:hypothetical protein